MDKHARILVVDDDESTRNTVKAILEDEGYIVDAAATAGGVANWDSDRAGDGSTMGRAGLEPATFGS